MSSNQSNEGEIRKNMIEAGLVDCIVALPGQLFRSTQIPACLWFLSRGRSNGQHRDRQGEILFVDARKLGHMEDRTHRDLSQEDIARIAETYHAWRGGEGAGDYADVPGFCKSAALEEVSRHGHVLTPAATWAQSPNPTTANPSRTRWPASPPNGGSSRKKPCGWMPPLRKTWNGWALEVALDCHQFFVRYQVPRGWQPWAYDTPGICQPILG